LPGNGLRSTTMRGDLNRAVEAVQYFGGIFPFAPGLVMEHHAGRRGTVPAVARAKIQMMNEGIET